MKFSLNQLTCALKGKRVLTMLVAVAIGVMAVGTRAQERESSGKPGTAVTPIQHVIVLFGENRSFDHVFGTYVPKRPDQFVYNLFSEGIVDASGNPSWNYGKSGQYSAMDESLYEISPGGKMLYTHVPVIAVGGPEFAADQECTATEPPPPCRSAGFTGPFLTRKAAKEYEPYLFPTYYPFELTGATGLKSGTLDTRITDNGNLPSGVVQLTAPGPNGTGLKYTDYSSSPVHRFYQMWQQTDCATDAIGFLNASGCQSDLFPWVEVTIGAGSNGKKPPSPFTDLSTGEGGTSVEFYNMQTGDAPYLKDLADHYTLSDNMHQGIMGGTGPNHVYLGYADAMWFDSSSGMVPPSTPKTPNTPPSDQIEDPNPLAGTNNWYMQDGYSGGTYTNCADTTQPGVASIVNYLSSLPTPIKLHCEAGHYYLLNNYNPAYNADGSSAFLYSAFTIPPTSQPHIGDVLAKAGLSYAFFGEDWNIYKTDPAGANPMDAYCNICNPFQYAKDIMTDPEQIAKHIADMDVFYSDVEKNELPNVSIIQPSGFADGHPASSKLQIFEGFVKDVVTKVKGSPAWSSTVIFVIFDEGGGYYDSGYIQPLDFFGDGTRMPFLVISPCSSGGYVNHSYADHASIDKFIERNWNLPTISKRSRDNLPNPETFPWDPYTPLNTPALTDLFDAFHFDRCDDKD
jgi:phospholipase C